MIVLILIWVIGLMFSVAYCWPDYSFVLKRDEKLDDDILLFICMVLVVFVLVVGWPIVLGITMRSSK